MTTKRGVRENGVEAREKPDAGRDQAISMDPEEGMERERDIPEGKILGKEGVGIIRKDTPGDPNSITFMEKV